MANSMVFKTTTTGDGSQKQSIELPGTYHLEVNSDRFKGGSGVHGLRMCLQIGLFLNIINSLFTTCLFLT